MVRNIMNEYELHFGEDCIGKRIDQLITENVAADISRSRIQSLIKDGYVTDLDTEEVIKQASLKLKTPVSVLVTIPPAKSSEIEAEEIKLDIVYEDDDLLVINKKAGLVVHPGAGNWSGTLVNALLHHCAGSLSGIGGVERPGIVHRLDKETSGLMIVAKNDQAHQKLSAQLADRSLKRIYWAFVWGTPMPPKGTVDTLYGRDPHNRLKMAVLKRDGKEAVTHYKVIERYTDDLYSLVECSLQTGRTHQIRVHMAHLGHCLVGDPLYGEQPSKIASLIKNSGLDNMQGQKIQKLKRQALHAKEIHFIHPRTGKPMHFTCDLPSELQSLWA